MAAPSDVVTRFLDAWAQPFGYRDAVKRWMSDDCVYENVGLTRSTGGPESAAVLDAFNTAMGFAAMRYDLLAIAAHGNTVLTERVDHLLDAGGQVLISIRLMGVFEVRGEQITAWRDYFDTVPFQPPK